MIYVYKKLNEEIILTDHVRDLKQDLDESVADKDDFLKNSNLLFTLDIDFNNSYINNNLRRWLVLWKDNTDHVKHYKYRKIIIDWLKSIKEEGIDRNRPLNYTPKLILNSEKNKLIDSFYQTKSFLVKNNIISDESPRESKVTKDHIKYDCDVYNYLEEIYPKLTNIVVEYTLLSEKKKIALQDFYKIKTRDNQISFLRENGDIDVTDIADFLPDWCIFNLLISEENLRKSNEKSDIDLPEFKNKRKIDDKDFLRRHKDVLVREEVFKAFGINEVWSGNRIKEKIKEIYTLYEYTEGKPRISEINKYFEVNKTRQGYRIGFRKLIKYS